MVKIIDRLIQKWTEESIGFNLGPCSSSENNLLNDVATRNLPAGIRSLLCHINGMDEDTEYDLLGYRFYPISEVYNIDKSDYFVFADYLHASYVFAEGPSGIYMIFSGIENARLLSDSMESFLELYLTNSKHLDL